MSGRDPSHSVEWTAGDEVPELGERTGPQRRDVGRFSIELMCGSVSVRLTFIEDPCYVLNIFIYVISFDARHSITKTVFSLFVGDKAQSA